MACCVGKVFPHAVHGKEARFGTRGGHLAPAAGCRCGVPLGPEECPGGDAAASRDDEKALPRAAIPCGHRVHRRRGVLAGRSAPAAPRLDCGLSSILMGVFLTDLGRCIPRRRIVYIGERRRDNDSTRRAWMVSHLLSCFCTMWPAGGHRRASDEDIA